MKEEEMNPENEKAQKQVKAIEYITGVAVGFSVVVCLGTGRNGTEKEFQIMPEDEFAAGPEVEIFFDWHTENNKQWFEHPLEAAADFVAKFQEFKKRSIPKNT